MIVLLGASGYMGQAFARELQRRGTPFVPLSRSEIDYAKFVELLHFLRQTKPEFLINAAGYTGKPNVDGCELAKADTVAGNVLLPEVIAHACEVARIPWGHVSSGCIYSGAKIIEGGKTRVEKDMTRPELRALVDKRPDCIYGFTENDTPNFSFRDLPCSFYSGCKALAEEAISEVGQHYSWRLRIPFDEYDSPRNYLSKIQRYSKVYDNVNSVSHRGEFVRACLDLWERRVPFGIYNVTNPGFVTTRRVVELVQEILHPDRVFEFWNNDKEFYRVAAKTPRSNCVMDVSKLLSTGVQMRPVEEAIETSLRRWESETQTNLSSPA
jgi:dTDP-4-dehydrorhamnose reductase